MLPTLLQKTVYEGLARVNRERLKHWEELTCRRRLTFDFARAFLELLRAKYQRVKRGREERSFEELMEDLLDALYCFEPDLRSGYKKVAGIIFGALGNEVKAKTRTRPRRPHGKSKKVVRGKTGQYGWNFPRQKKRNSE